MISLPYSGELKLSDRLNEIYEELEAIGADKAEARARRISALRARCGRGPPITSPADGG